MFRRYLLLVLAAALSSSVVVAQPAVTNTDPVNQDTDVGPTKTITVTFDQALDPSTVNSSTVRVFGRWSGPMTSVIDVVQSNTRIRIQPSSPFFAGEWITVSVNKGVTASNGTPIRGHVFNFWIRTLPGSLDMQQIGTINIRQNGEGPIASYGAYAGDLNNDGWSDLLVPNEVPDDARVFLNNLGAYSGGFTMHPLTGGANVSPNEGADFNNDGEIDVAVGSSANSRLHVMMGNGNGGFSSINSYDGGNQVRGVCIVDVDMDGDDDIVTSNRDANYVGIYRNNGTGAFAAETNLEGGGDGEAGCAATDANNDGITDVFVGFNYSQEVGLLLGNANGGFTFSAKRSVDGRPWMLTTGDMNGDGNADVISANSLGASGSVILGDGKRRPGTSRELRCRQFCGRNRCGGPGRRWRPRRDVLEC